MHLYRKTAVVEFVLFSSAEQGTLPLANERDFGVNLKIEDVTYPAQSFRSPINDEQWRMFDRKVRDCNIKHNDTMYRDATCIRSLGNSLYQSLATVSPALREFLGRAGQPRRLVIQTKRPELHLLPWAALIDDAGAFLAAGDLSVVQSWDPFSSTATTQSTLGKILKLKSAQGPRTPQVTLSSLEGLPAEIEQEDVSLTWQDGKRIEDVDILHLEAHGDAVTNQIGDIYSTKLSATFGEVPIALLWSCCSGAMNSWGESPSLCLHRGGAVFVLSFLAELHVLDAASISAEFYREVFGPAASRDPETALVRIRAGKFASPNDFPCANWASMTLHLRAPLDLSALPLNGPRVPQDQWTDGDPADAANGCECPGPGPMAAATGTTTSQAGALASGSAAGAAITTAITPVAALDSAVSTTAVAFQQTDGASSAATATPSIDNLWKDLATKVGKLQPGSLNEFQGFADPALSADATAKLPKTAFKAWRGNVIRLDGATDPLAKYVLTELNISSNGAPNTDAAERLVWFFSKIEQYGSPLIVWTNAAKRHQAFLKQVQPSSNLTFLLMYGPQPAPTLIDLVNEDRLADARAASASLQIGCGDDQLSAAYYAFARSEKMEESLGYILRVSSRAEQLLLMANFISRRGMVPDPRPDWLLHHPDGKLTSLQQQHCQEDCFRSVISDSDAPLRESGRAKHEFGYLLSTLGKTSVAEMLYSQALADLESCPQEQHDYRWHGTIGRLLRDWAHLLSSSPERLDKARELLDRAMAIHQFHGRRQQIGYCLETAARIAITGRRFSEAIDNAADAANLMEILNNWRGWGEAMKVLFDCLAETRETTRMHSLADLAIEKLQRSNLDDDQRERLRRAFTYEKANAHWIAGQLEGARSELKKLGLGVSDGAWPELDPEFETEVKRLWTFLVPKAQ